ncbi:hypothetical protein PJP13_24250 [Mycobacterium kansasii]
MSIEERITELHNDHRQPYRDAPWCRCGLNFKTDREHSAHVASVLVAELGLQPRFMQTFDGTHCWWATPSQWVPNSEMTGIFPRQES